MSPILSLGSLPFRRQAIPNATTRGDYNTVPLAIIKPESESRPPETDDTQPSPHLSQTPLLDAPPQTVNQQVPPLPWEPLMLRRWVLSQFAIVSVLLIVSLEVILKISTDKQGFGPTSTKPHYLWTYGPSLVFTIIAAFWTQVDYRSRLMQPWRELTKPLRATDDTLLLDYISPNSLTTMIKATAKHHWPVCAALFGSFLLKLLIVISTGLFVLQPASILQHESFQMTHEFQLSNFNSSAIDDVAGLLYAGVQFNNISYPAGTNASFAVELFNLTRPIAAPTYNLTATVASFSTDVVCEPATLEILGVIDCSSLDDCEQAQASAKVEGSTCMISDLQGLIVYNRNIWVGIVLNAMCEKEDNITDDDRDRLVILNHYQYAMRPGEAVRITNSTALICQPLLKVQRSDVTIDESGLLIQVSDGEQLDVSSQITAKDIANAVVNTTAQLSIHDIVPYKSFEGFFALILSSQSSTNDADLSNTDLQAKGARTVFQGVASQISKRYLLQTNSVGTNSTVQGHVQLVQQRLFVRELSMRLMESALCLLALTSLLLVSVSHGGSTPQDPACIARIVSLISESLQVLNDLSQTGYWPAKDLSLKLRQTYSADSRSFLDDHHNLYPKYVVESQEETDVDKTKRPDKEVQYWQPFTTRWASRIALLAIPLAILVLLEILLEISQHNDGITEIHSERWTQFGSSYVPALMMVLTKLLFSASDFNLRILDPYVQLKGGVAKAKSSILNKTIYTWKADAFWASLMAGRIAVGASTFAVILASFLTIAVSGLYTIKEVSHASTVNLTRLDQFSNPFDRPANIISSMAARLVVYEKIDSPAGTEQEYVYPNITAYSSDFLDLNASVTKVSVPVQRGVLSCGLLHNDAVTLDYSLYDIGAGYSGVVVNWTDSSVDWTDCRTNSVVINQTTTGVALKIEDGLFAKYQNYPQASAEAGNCPASWGYFGNWTGRRATEFNVFNCWSSIRETQANLSFAVPAWKLQSMDVDEHNTKNVSTSVDTALDLHSWVFNGTLAQGQVDNVFAAVMRDQTTDSVDTSFLSRQNWDKLQARIQGAYGLAFAQILNVQGRNTSLSAQSTIPGTATSFSTHRLVQDVASTRVLQGLLLGMMLCAIVCLFTVRLHDVVPKNPCSIAAQVSLVAGSSMMAKLPPGAQWMGDKEFDALFDGELYSMGWRSGENGDRKFVIDVADGIWEKE
ncbi:hypothetical protein K491DRAFT_718462 [Lophiostoma macrostomum CBS 122681]|uniref:Uncharacterized protein n=1 Tax=Lophiostoma macrostomum CBS 122681 TaxID=1314788 RepID=A0A6A6T379_9PLEO|nr:hypothetical protein K491DRAFT_718462 [Lophiostoma macrostomum CBS 122681]